MNAAVFHAFGTADGSVAQAKLVRPLHPVLDTQALNIIQNMPKRKPAVWHDKKVDCMDTLPAKFKP